MLVFLEKFVLPVLTTLVVGVILLNPLKLDRAQRISLFVATVCAAYFIGHTIRKNQQVNASTPAQPAFATPSEQQKTSGDAKTSGPNSPAVTGGVNSFTYDQHIDSKESNSKPPQ